MKTILVTGATGFIGSHLTESMVEKGYNVIAFDRYNSNNDWGWLENSKYKNDFQVILGDIRDYDSVSKSMIGCDAVFHLAAIAGVRNSFNNPQEYFDINVKGTENILKTFQNIDELVFASSSSVYGELKQNEFPVKETHSLNPISPYGESKKQSELLCEHYSKSSKIRTSILRFYTVYGPRQRPDEAIMKFLNLSISGKPIPIFDDGTKIRDFTYISDIVNGIILSQKFGNGTYNLGSGNPISVNEMVDIIEEKLGKKIKRQYVDSPKGDVFKTHADITKAEKELKFFPTIKFQNGIEKTIEWHMNNYSKIS